VFAHRLRRLRSVTSRAIRHNRTVFQNWNRNHLSARMRSASAVWFDCPRTPTLT
jgi:hypothetical protein